MKRTHLVDAATEGALLLELYSRDGIGAMISTDFYEVCAPGTQGLKPVFHLTLHFDRLPGQFCRLLERLAGHYIEHCLKPEPLALPPARARRRHAMEERHGAQR